MIEITVGGSVPWRAAQVCLSPAATVVAQPAPWDGAKVGKCYSNVQEMIGRFGGEAAYGWALTDFGPHQISGPKQPPLYRRWLNHVVWRDGDGKLREVSPNAIIDNHQQTEFLPTEFLLDPEATFEIMSPTEWYTRPTRYIPLRAEGVLVTELLTQAQHARGDERNRFIGQALSALQLAGFRPREWKVENVGERTGSIWLIVE